MLGQSSDLELLGRPTRAPTKAFINAEQGALTTSESHDLFAWMPVLEGRRVWADVDAVLDDLASGEAEIVPLEIGARDSRRLLRGAAHVRPPMVTELDRSTVIQRPRAARTVRARRPGSISAVR
jgi:hypothetical protein